MVLELNDYTNGKIELGYVSYPGFNGITGEIGLSQVLHPRKVYSVNDVSGLSTVLCTQSYNIVRLCRPKSTHFDT